MEAERKHNYTESPRKNANILSYLTFWWVLPVLFKGKKKELDLNDLYKPVSVILLYLSPCSIYNPQIPARRSRSQ